MKQNKKVHSAAEVLESIRPLLEEGGEIMRSAHRIGDAVSEKSGDSNFVTKYDLAVQELLLARIGERYPEAVFFAEEKENERLTEALTFIIDPIDGTTNFIRGQRHSCISVGVYEGREPLCGMVYDPYADELFYALHGEGAYRLSGGVTERLTLKDRPLSASLAVFGSDPYRKSQTAGTTLAIVDTLLRACLDIRRSGSAALDLVGLAVGRYDIFCENLVSPWDFAAGRQIVAEAGGVVSRLDGSDMPIDEPSSIVAGAPSACREFLALWKVRNENK